MLTTARVVSSSLELNTVLGIIADEAATLLETDGSQIYLLDPDGSTLRCVYAQDIFQDDLVARPLAMGEGLVGHVAVHGKAEIVNSIQADDRVTPLF